MVEYNSARSEKLGPRDCPSLLPEDLCFNFCFALETHGKKPLAPVLKAYFNKILLETRIFTFFPSLMLFEEEKSQQKVSAN